MIIELSDFFNNPSLISLGPLKIQYYAITWLLSAVFIYLYLKSNEIIIELGISNEKVNDLVFFYGLFIGAMCGGRVGYMLFYGSDQLLNNPLSLFYVWQGGLSFHGGLLGVIISFLIFTKKNNLSFFRLMDGVALSMAQWYPKMAEYDFEGWHTDAYIGREFHGVWGNFDVTLNIDKTYTVGGTGNLQNPQEVGHGYEDKTQKLNVKFYMR